MGKIDPHINIGYEVNNPFSIIIGKLELLKRSIENNEMSKEKAIYDISKCVKAAMSISSLVKSKQKASQSPKLI